MPRAALVTAVPVVAVLTLLLVAQSSRAQPADPNCMQTAMTQSALTNCAVTFAEAAEARLGKSYRALLCHLAPEEKVALEAAQRAWEQYREVDCAFWGSGGGSIAPMNEQFCKADVTSTRADELDRWPPNSPRDKLAACD